MIGWLLTRRREIVRSSRWIVAACAAALVGIADLPHGRLDRIVAIMAIGIVAVVFVTWLAIASLTVVHPRLLERWHRSWLDAGRRP